MKFVYVSATGATDATRASIPLHLAVNGSVEAGHDTAIVLAGDGADIIIGDNAETMEGLGVPPVRELLDKIKDHSVPVYV